MVQFCGREELGSSWCMRWLSNIGNNEIRTWTITPCNTVITVVHWGQVWKNWRRCDSFTSYILLTHPIAVSLQLLTDPVVPVLEGESEHGGTKLVSVASRLKSLKLMLTSLHLPLHSEDTRYLYHIWSIKRFSLYHSNIRWQLFYADMFDKRIKDKPLKSLASLLMKRQYTKWHLMGMGLGPSAHRNNTQCASVLMERQSR